MTAKSPKNRTKTRHYKRRKQISKKHYAKRIFIGIFCLIILIIGWHLYQKARFYYAMYFKSSTSYNLSNTKYEEERIAKIVTEYQDKTFGIDISHYQRKQDIAWDSLAIANGSIPISFIVLRATMGKKSKDQHFEEFWQNSKKHNLIRGAYHFYRPDEDPVQQANNFLDQVKLESGDLPPVLDIEKLPHRISKEQLIENLKIWCKIVEQAYGAKPIIYSYYFYHRDVLKNHFEDYPLWLANYNDVLQPSEGKEWDFWQFSEKGIVQGIRTKVDVNIYNGGLWALKSLTID